MSCIIYFRRMLGAAGWPWLQGSLATWARITTMTETDKVLCSTILFLAPVMNGWIPQG